MKVILIYKDYSLLPRAKRITPGDNMGRCISLREHRQPYGAETAFVIALAKICGVSLRVRHEIHTSTRRARDINAARQYDGSFEEAARGARINLWELEKLAADNPYIVYDERLILPCIDRTRRLINMCWKIKGDKGDKFWHMVRMAQAALLPTLENPLPLVIYAPKQMSAYTAMEVAVLKSVSKADVVFVSNDELSPQTHSSYQEYMAMPLATDKDPSESFKRFWRRYGAFLTKREATKRNAMIQLTCTHWDYKIALEEAWRQSRAGQKPSRSITRSKRLIEQMESHWENVLKTHLLHFK